MGIVYEKTKDESVEQILVGGWITLNIPYNTPKSVRARVLERWLPTSQDTFDFSEDDSNDIQV